MVLVKGSLIYTLPSQCSKYLSPNVSGPRSLSALLPLCSQPQLVSITWTLSRGSSGDCSYGAYRPPLSSTWGHGMPETWLPLSLSPLPRKATCYPHLHSPWFLFSAIQLARLPASTFSYFPHAS